MLSIIGSYKFSNCLTIIIITTINEYNIFIVILIVEEVDKKSICCFNIQHVYFILCNLHCYTTILLIS